MSIEVMGGGGGYPEYVQEAASGIPQITASTTSIKLGYNRFPQYIDYLEKKENNTLIYENNSRALARKKSSISTLFKFLYRNEQVDKNITDGFNPIKLPKPQPDAIKRLDIDEVAIMLDAVETGQGLTE